MKNICFFFHLLRFCCMLCFIRRIFVSESVYFVAVAPQVAHIPSIKHGFHFLFWDPGGPVAALWRRPELSRQYPPPPQLMIEHCDSAVLVSAPMGTHRPQGCRVRGSDVHRRDVTAVGKENCRITRTGGSCQISPRRGEIQKHGISPFKR